MKPLIFGFLLLINCIKITTPLSDIDDIYDEDLRTEEGKKQYNLIKADSEMPRYGPCWKKALTDLETGCKKLTDEMQTRLSLSFTNCFLKKIGRKTYPCFLDQEVSDCLKNIDSNAYSTFSNFFTHTQNMCFFLQNQIWHEEAKNTVNELLESSNEVSKRLEKNSKLHDKIIEAQIEVLKNDEKLLQNGEELKITLANSKQSVIDVLEEFKVTTGEQRLALVEIFDRVSKLQSLFMGEFTGLYALIYYICVSSIAYLITASQRTSGARFGIYAILILNVIFERVLISWGTNLSELTIYGGIWWGRNVGVGLCLIILSLAAYWYKDYQAINNKILMEVHKECLEIKNNFSMLGFQNTFLPALNGLNGSYQPVSSLPALRGNSFLTNSTLSNRGNSFLSNSTLSNRGISGVDEQQLLSMEDFEEEDDKSYVASSSGSESDSSESSEEIFETMPGSRSTTPSSRSTTPLPPSRQSTPKTGSFRNNFSGNGNSFPEANRIDIVSRGSSPYNLRSRNRYSSPLASQNNPMVYRESPKQFSRLVEQMAAMTKQHGVKIREIVNEGKKPNSNGKVKNSQNDSG